MTVVDRIRGRAAQHASSPAVIEGDRILSYRDLFERVDRLSEGLRSLGLGKGDAVLAWLPNVHEAIECEIACLQSGLPWITLTARLTWPEVRGVIASCEPRVLVTDPAGAAKLQPSECEVPHVVVTRAAGSPLELAVDYESLLAGSPPRRPKVDIGPEDMARLRYTSGTTGSAKAAVLPHRVYEASLDNLLEALHPLGPSDRALHVAPLTHGSGALVYPMLLMGGANVLASGFDIEAVLELVETRRVTTMFTVPTMLQRLVASSGLTRRDLGSLRSLIYGGAPMAEAPLREAVAKLGPALLHIYGMTEAPWPITVLSQHEHRLDNPRLRSVGKPTAFCQVRVVNEAGHEVGPGEVGEIQIRGRNVMTGYYRDEAATRAVLAGGWLASGDLGHRDEEGYLYIVGRKKEVIISGGFNVYASEVEAVLSLHPSIEEAAVFGLPHEDWGELVCAVVVPKGGAILEVPEIHAFIRSRLSGYKCPRRIEISGELPKNPSGKIAKKDLMRRFAGS